MAEYKDKSKLKSVNELQAFLKDELGESEEALISRAFTPITDGLGLESPKRPDPLFHEKVEKVVAEPPPPKKLEVPPTWVDKQIQNFLDSDSVAKEEAPVAFEPKPVIEEAPKTLQNTLAAAPPPLPTPPDASLLKRAAAIAIDQVFVLTLFSLALVITSNAMNGFSSGFSFKILQSFSQPTFLRLAIIEFAVIWLGYLGICVFSMNTTFGMWVWGLRISFGDKMSENYSMRKIMRVVWSFIFCAPILPMFLLFIRKQGKNIIDILSGSTVSGSEA